MEKDELLLLTEKFTEIGEKFTRNSMKMKEFEKACSDKIRSDVQGEQRIALLNKLCDNILRYIEISTSMRNKAIEIHDSISIPGVKILMSGTIDLMKKEIERRTKDLINYNESLVTAIFRGNFTADNVIETINRMNKKESRN